MKLGIFTDSHYSSAEITDGKRYNSKSLGKIKDAYAYFEKQNCDLIVCLGDLLDTERTVEKEKENLREIAQVIHGVKIPTVCLMGNHDAFTLTLQEFYSIIGLNEPKDTFIDGKQLIFLDACYFKNGSHYQPGDSNWTDTYYPFEQELLEKLKNAKSDVYIFIHQNIDTAIVPSHRLFNADALFNIINGSGKVKAVFQGHYHKGQRSKYDGVKYIAFPAMCENDDAVFILDI